MTAFNRNLIWLITAVAVVAIAYFFADILMYILVAWVLSMLGKPFMNFYQSKIRIRNWHLNSTGAAILTIFSFFFNIKNSIQNLSIENRNSFNGAVACKGI